MPARWTHVLNVDDVPTPALSALRSRQRSPDRDLWLRADRSSRHGRCCGPSDPSTRGSTTAPSGGDRRRPPGRIARRHARKAELDVDLAVAELLAVPAVSPELLAQEAGITLGFYRSEMDFESRAVAAALLLTAGADVTRLRHWFQEGAERRAIRPLSAR